jgi:hypothetical protein
MTDEARRPPTFADFDAHAAELRRQWGRPVGGPFWDEIEPAFAFGWAMALDPALAGHVWSEVEADLADHWYRPQAASEEMAWDQVRDAVRLAWDLARATAAAAALAGHR